MYESENTDFKQQQEGNMRQSQMNYLFKDKPKQTNNYNDSNFNNNANNYSKNNNNNNENNENNNKNNNEINNNNNNNNIISLSPPQML